jgi:hypothetical protein
MVVGFHRGNFGGVWEGQSEFIDFAVGFEKYTLERDNDCGDKVSNIILMTLI